MKWIRQTLAGLSVLALAVTTTALFAEPANADSRDTDAPAKRVDTPPKAPSARAMPPRAPLYYDTIPRGTTSMIDCLTAHDACLSVRSTTLTHSLDSGSVTTTGKTATSSATQPTTHPTKATPVQVR